MSELNAFLAEFEQKSDSSGPLQDLTIALKDNICVAGIETTAASKILKGFVPTYDATVVKKLRESGATLKNKTNLDEFAMGSSTENSAFGVVKNPWDESRVPGGSSGGSAAVVAAGLVDAALGTDTGGSVRQPASFCGVVGLKPTYGRVSRWGVIALGSSLDQIGVFSRSVKGAAEVLEAISGHDPKDATSSEREVGKYASNLGNSVKGLKIGVPKEFFEGGLDAEVKKAIEDAIKWYRENGAEIVDISLPHSKYAIATYYVVLPAEASSNLARYDGVRYGFSAKAEPLLDNYFKSRSEGFGPEPVRRIMLGSYVLSSGYYDAYYLKAQKVRTLIRQDYEKAFDQVDVILGPTTPTTAFKVGEKADDPIAMYLNDIYTVPANLAGNPAISVPAGFDGSNLPIGLQLIGPMWGEQQILDAANAFEGAHDYHDRRPK
jgi:aspartyl-tRNA(Asn)/glutamyl-tRNA(Gln) amidotransferase subunit A